MNLYSNSTGSRRVVTFLAAAAALTFAQAASAGVVPGDTFTFAIAAFNNAGTTGYVLGSGEIATFGGTQTYTGVGANGQNYTITSSEVVGASSTTDTFKVTTASNFLTQASIDGAKMTQMFFSIGDADSGVGVTTGADPVNFSGAVTSFTATGGIVYGSANTVFTFTPSIVEAGTALGAGGLSFSMDEGVSDGTTAISTLGVHEFDYTITYANPVSVVPETSNWALLLAGLGGMSLVSRRSRKS